MTSAIIVAAGSGARMQNAVRKQYHTLAGIPVVAHTLKAISASPLIEEIVLVIPQDDVAYCRENILQPLGLQARVLTVAGGAERQDSVYNGLCALAGGGIVVIHDGVRPFVSRERLEACIRGAETSGACILGVPAYDTLKQVRPSGAIVRTLDRRGIWLAQTPQAFAADLIRRAHCEARTDGFRGTDDAALVERLGVTITILPGSRFNLKITTPQDLILARALLQTGSELTGF
jgi:2-C-methyl-D-erythritol 4-phosphate cytidylyltransferase